MSETDLVDDGQIVPVESDDLFGMIGKKPDFFDPEFAKDLRPDAVNSQTFA